MTVDAAIAYALVIRDAEDERDLALVTLAAEVRRLRAVYERIAEIPAIGLSCGEPTVARLHVLRAISDDESLPWMEEYATVCAERNRLRAAVKAVRALPSSTCATWGEYRAHLDRDDVLAALEGE